MCTLPLRFRPATIFHNLKTRRVPGRSGAKVLIKICCLLLLSTIAATRVYAELPHFEHIIIVIQENRTPDNLFGGNPGFEPGVDIVPAAIGHPYTLAACFDPSHRHSAWEAQYSDTTGLYTPCASYVDTSSCPPNLPNWCLQDTFVPASEVDPYFQIASHYGWANDMFQTTQGPSYPAHFFLFSGTSAPTNDPSGDIDFTKYFVSGNSAGFDDSGCTANLGETANDIDRTGHESYLFTPPFITWGNAGYACYRHASLADLLDHATPTALSWRYYAWHKPKAIWNTPYSLYDMCQPNYPGTTGSCRGPHFTGSDPDVITTEQQVLNDIGNCRLRRVSWVIPDGNWSDHPGQAATLNGPAWVTSIVNKIGSSWTVSGNQCDYWGDQTSVSDIRHQPTLILITWDDWGGWYDHVPPYQILVDKPGNPCVVWGCGYISGFRVPLLVVSAFTDEHTISGPSSNPDCANNTYCHDFGSILKFVESNWGLPGIGSRDGGVSYADDFAPDNKNNNIPLSEFFNLTAPRSFHVISLPPGSPAESYFTSYTGAVAPDNEN